MPGISIIKKKAKRSPPRVYHDGLIPADNTTYHSYPEVVPEDHDASKHEKSYPEVAPAPSSVAPSPAQLSSTLSPPSNTPHPASHLAHAHAPPPGLHGHHAPGLPRTSGVHSLRQAWSEFDGQQDGLPPLEHRSWWKRPITWAMVIAFLIIIALAGILGGVASGGIKTAFDSNTSSTTSAVTNPSCPTANNLNYIKTNKLSEQKSFRIRCDRNYAGGDGKFEVQNATTSLQGCIDLCAEQGDCVGAVWRSTSTIGGQEGPKCWLKEYLGKEATETGVQSAVLARDWE